TNLETIIDPGNDYRRHMSGGSLIISDLDKDQDTGVYQCTAVNTWGAVLSRRASLRFAYLDNFKSQADRSAVHVREGQGVVLLCGPPVNSGELTYAWIFNEYPRFVQQDSRRFISQETGNLYVAKVERSDVGNYTCVVNNTVTGDKVLSSPTPLVLRTDGVMGEYEPKIEVHFPESVPAAKESAVRLECFALGNPVPEISWRRTSGVPFPSKVKMKNSNAVLEIPNFQQEDAGTYECVAENWRGKNAARGRLSFHAKPHWLLTMVDTALSVEANLFWECKANGKPKPSYSWLKNGLFLLSPQGRIQIENGALSIAALNLSDSGMYQCVAENKHGFIYSSAQLMVLASPPSFSKSPLKALLKARTGSEVTLECKPEAWPPAISLWKKGNEILMTLLPNGTLRIANATRQDAGSYTCVAKNQFGTASTTGKLLITEPTRITMRPTNTEIIVGESAVLPCQIASDPALDVSFSWAFNGQLIDFQRDGNHFERVGGSVSGDLMIRNIQLSHGGKYVCLIDTDVESLSTSAILVVKGPPGPPDKVTVEEITDSTAQLSWTPGRDNGSPITGYIIQARTPFTVGWQAVDTVPEVINGNLLTATVVGLNAWVEYEFRVVARNTVGLGEPSPASTKTRTEDSIPDTAPTDVGGGGGTKSELVITWEELQNGDGFGYIIAFRPLGLVTWTRAAISTPGIGRYVFRNDTIPAFSPFEVKVGAYNNRGEGPFSSIATVYSAEEVPSVAPKRVRTRSVSAVQIEVIWEALPALPERVLGYEVRFDSEEKLILFFDPLNTWKSNAVFILLILAPDRAPHNIQWTMIGSTLSLHWDPVIAMETESKVTGYLVLLKKNHYNDVTALFTNKTAVELTLNANSNYLIQVKAMSEGGEGVGSEPIHIHKLSMGARGSGAVALKPVLHISLPLVGALLCFLH
uniref:Contactin 3b n=1 Tax=Takifugu rubripes TaxID=31033 RepID=A0A674N4J5_TAKRU